MHPEVASQLLTLNRTFYEKVAKPFSETRAQPQPGFRLLLDYLPQSKVRLLDVGCGQGRLGQYLRERNRLEQYVGVDFSPSLLEEAKENVEGIFLLRDLTKPDSLKGLAPFNVIASLAVLQHIPGRSNRISLLEEMRKHLLPGGHIFLSTWQFLDSERQRRKIRDWGLVDLSPDEVDENDYLLTWNRGGSALRYVSFIDEAEMTALAIAAGLEIVKGYRSDGREGNLNLYTILRRRADGSAS